MFRDSLFETSRATTSRGWATFVSFVVETAAIGVLILLPLIYTDALPALRLGETPLPPPRAPRVSDMAKNATHLVPVPDDLRDSVIRVPVRMPDRAAIIKDRDARPPQFGNDADCDPCVDGGIPLDEGPRGGDVISLLLKPKPLTAMPKLLAPNTIRVSRMDPGMLIARVEPRYPALAQKTRTQGQVILAAVIGRDGRVQNLRAVSGHPLLIKSAIDAVQQWRYRPTMLNGQPVEVETQIVVNFTMN